MKKLIINADDFGYSRAVNYGVIDAYTLGALTSCTIMVNMPGFEHAISLAKCHPQLGVGIHLVLTCGAPLIDGHQTIAKPNGDFYKIADYKKGLAVDPNEVYLEWRAQIERFLERGLKPTHLDSHHHINAFKDILPVFIKLAQEYQLPVRNNFNSAQTQHLITTDYFESDMRILANQKALHALFSQYNSVEIMTHPAYLDQSVWVGSSYNIQRIDELALLIQRQIKDNIRQLPNVLAVSYLNLAK